MRCEWARYDAALVVTSVAFGVVAAHTRARTWPLVVYAAAASVLFRTSRGVCGARTPSVFLAHDYGAALLALLATAVAHRDSRAWVALTATCFSASHALPYGSTASHAAHALGHLCVIAWASEHHGMGR